MNRELRAFPRDGFRREELFFVSELAPFTGSALEGSEGGSSEKEDESGAEFFHQWILLLVSCRGRAELINDAVRDINDRYACGLAALRGAFILDPFFLRASGLVQFTGLQVHGFSRIERHFRNEIRSYFS